MPSSGGDIAHCASSLQYKWPSCLYPESISDSLALDEPKWCEEVLSL